MSSPPPKHSLSSPTSGNTPHQVLPTPSSSTTVSRHPTARLSVPVQQRKELEQQLLEKQKQLQESNSGIGRNVLAKQVAHLQEKLKELDSNTREEPQPTSSVDRLRSLERDLSSYRSHPLSPGISSIRNKEKLLNQRSPNNAMHPMTAGLDPLPSPTTSTLLPPVHGHDSTSLLPLPPPPTGSTPTKRRSKVPNTDRRNTDIEFATEIGQGLLLEVRKMQALLQEKEEKLRTLENQKADLERAAEAMAKQMRQREENEEKLKEETWNLELAKQELVISVTDLQSNLSKANAEQNKLAKQVNDLRSEIEQLRDREEKLTSNIDGMKQRHEQDMSSIRRQAAAIQREKSDQTKQIEALTSELAIAKAQSRMSKHALSSENESSSRRTGPAGDQTDSDHTQSTLAVKNDTSSTSTSPPESPKQSPASRNQAMEVDTLKTSLAHAHRMVSNLRTNWHREKTEKFELKKLLAESQETIEQLQNDPRMWVDAGPSRNNNALSSGALVRGEDGQLIGRRPHKASTSSSLKRRAGKKAGRHTNRLHHRSSAANDRDSVYSYSSMSDNEESEMDSYDDSDVEKTLSKPVSPSTTTGYLPLSSELSQVAQKPVMVDAEMNTDPIDLLPPIVPKLSNEATAQRSLGDELNLAMSRSPSQEAEESSIKNTASGLLTGAAAALGMNALTSKKEEVGVEISTQTETEPKIIRLEISTQTDVTPAPLVEETCTQTDPEPEKPQVIEAEIQTDVPASVEMLVQTDGAKLTEMATQTMTPQLETMDQMAIVDHAPTMVALQSVTQQAMDIEPEDPSIALAAATAATAAAIGASRLTALEAAVDSFTQSDVIVADTLDQATQSDALLGTDCGVQSEMVETVDTGMQSEVTATKDADVQYDLMIETKDADTQYDTMIETKDADTQYDTMIETKDMDTQYDIMIDTKDVDTQYDIMIETKDASVQHEEHDDTAALAIGAGADMVPNTNHISTGTQSDHVDTTDGFTQCETITGLDHETQYDLMGIDHSTQSILTEAIECGVQSDKSPTVDVNVQTTVTAAETKDADVQVTAAIAETKDVDVQVTAAVPESKNIGVQYDTSDIHIPIPIINNNDTDEEFYDAHSKPSSRNTVKNAAAFSNLKPVSDRSITDTSNDETKRGGRAIAAASGLAPVTDSQLAGKETVSPVHQIQPENTNRSIVSSNAEARNQAEANSQATDNDTLNIADSEDVATDNDTLNNAASEGEKLFSKSETDALIASAVAIALANVAASKKKHVREELIDDCKRHTCDMSLNDHNNNSKTNREHGADSAVASHSSASLDDNDELMPDSDFGNVVVHISTEEDTITSSPYQEKRQRERDMGNQQPEQQYKKLRILEDGPTTVFDQAPIELVMGMKEDDFSNEREITEADVPVRPANPPPIALLNKASRASAIIDNRSMSPISARSKGKQPYDPYSDLESQPSRDNMHHHQQHLQHLAHLDKRRSTSMSSLSTNNTNEQLHSITSSQYNTSGARSNSVTTTDPSTINLITQTMIGDWLWKYTRKAVGGGMSERRHQRYFWIHPYTRTLYWSTAAPGLDGSQAKAKSAMIENISAIPDLTTDGLPNVSILIQTSHRQIKLTAPNMEKHDLWFESISYLLTRNGSSGIGLLTDKKADHVANTRSLSSGASSSLLRRPSFRRVHDIFQQPTTCTSSLGASTGDHLDDFDDEALEDVRMCCNGKHHVSKLEKDHPHRHQYRKRKIQNRRAIATIG